MPASRTIGLALLATTLGGMLMVAASTPSTAQPFFDFFRRSPLPAAPSSGAPQRHGFFEDLFGFFRGDSERIEDKAGSGVYANYCVRTCDGKFFPVNAGKRDEAALGKVCKAMCPAAETSLFHGAGIEHAVSGDGKEYTALPTAFAYRTGIVNNCTCNGRDPFGVVNIDIHEDPTLRAGDIVVQPEQVVVFQGSPVPHSIADFAPIRDAKNVSAATRKQLSSIRVLQDNPHATFAKTMPVIDAAEAPAQNPSPEAPTRNENAPAAEPPARIN